MTDIEPVKGEEAQIIVQRLFDKVDPVAAQAASADYHESLHSNGAGKRRDVSLRTQPTRTTLTELLQLTLSIRAC